MRRHTTFGAPPLAFVAPRGAATVRSPVTTEVELIRDALRRGRWSPASYRGIAARLERVIPLVDGEGRAALAAQLRRCLRALRRRTG